MPALSLAKAGQVFAMIRHRPALKKRKTRWAALASNTIRSLRGMVRRKCTVLHWRFVYVKLLPAVERTKGSTGTELHFLNQGFP